jgi:hypothetical protein
MKENKFVIGYDVRIVGRLVRFVGGLIPLILILMDLRTLDKPIPSMTQFSLLRDTGLYLIAVAAAYTAVYYLLSDRVLDWLGRVNPWIPTAIFLGPPIFVAVLSLGPVAFRLGPGIYVVGAAILAAVMSYGGCEVVALPALLFSRRHVVYCPYNLVDAMEDAVVRNVRKQSTKKRSTDRYEIG